MINVYKNNKLMLIMEAVYDDGELQSYKQVIPFTTSRKKDVWCISQRKSKGVKMLEIPGVITDRITRRKALQRRMLVQATS